MPQPLVRGPLVGREGDLSRLAQLAGLDDTGSSGAVVLLAGDAGVGKTRLLAELSERARQQGRTVLVGHCVDLGEGALPYLPFREMFGRLATDLPELAAEAVERHPTVGRLMPGVGAGSGDRPRGDTALLDRADVMEAVLETLRWLGTSAPLLVVAEDLHWADPSTRDLLGYLFGREQPGFSAIGSYRSDDLHRRHPLRASVAEWMRLPAVNRMSLSPLADDDVRTLVNALVERPVADADVRAIMQRAEGNAFFVEELTAAAGGGPRGLPTDLADLLLIRLDRLDEPARRAVRAASVAGRAVSHDLLASVTDVDDHLLQPALRAAVEANVLVPDEQDRYAFRHALLAEAVYGDLLPGERVRLHGAYAAALGAGASDGSAAELAKHARAAGDVRTATLASIRAGDEAMAVAGSEEAIRHYEAALELMSAADGLTVDGTPIDVVELAEKASQAAAAAGDVFRAVALVQDQLDQLGTDADGQARARLLLALGGASMLGDTGVDAMQVTTEALDLVPAEPPTPLRARALALHARAHMERRRDDAAARWVTEALDLARTLDLPDVMADAKTTHAHLTRRGGDISASLQAMESALTSARAGGEPAAELRSQFNIGGLHYEHARWDEARSAYLAATKQARDFGRQWAPYGVDARAMLGIVAYICGDWDETMRQVDTSTESPPEMAWALLTATGLAVAAGRGDRQALDRLPLIRATWERDGMIAILSGVAAIDLHGDARDLGAAIAVHDDVVASVGGLWHNKMFHARIRLSALLLGQMCAAVPGVGPRERASMAELGLQHAEVADAVYTDDVERGPGPESQAWRARADAEHARLRWLAGVHAPDEDELVASWERDVAAFGRLGHVFELARSRSRLGSVLRAVGRQAEAAEQTGLAVDTARRLGAAPLLAELGSVPLRTPRKPREASTELLTDRELEVLVLVAAGRSNREIGQQLFISPKTASVHVSHILAKIGAGGRTEAVALARTRGLLPDDPT